VSTSPDFGELRSLLAVTPSAEAFDAVIDFIEAALPELGEREYLDRWDPYVESALRRWPDATRRVREDRLKALEDAPAPWGLQVRTLEYAGSTITEKRCAGLCDAEHLANITRLDLRDASTSWAVIRQLAAGAPFVLDAFALRKSTSSGAAPEDLVPLFTSPMLSALRSLEFTGWARFGAKSMTTLVGHLPLEKLEELDLYGTGIGKSGLKALLECEALANLVHLDVGAVEFNDKLSKLLGEATHLGRLERLGLSRTGFSPAVVADFAGATHLTGLEALDLSGVALERDDVRALTSPEVWPNLRELDLSGTRLTAESMGDLWRAECFAGVEELRIGENILARSSLADAAPWPSLRSLSLDKSFPSVDGWRALTQAPFWDQLERFVATEILPAQARVQGSMGWRTDHANVTRLRVEFWAQVLAAPLPAALEVLDLSSNRLDASHGDLLFAQECMATLERLELGSTLYYGDSPSLGEGLDALARTSMPELSALCVHAREEDQDALARVARSEHLPKLRELTLTTRGSSPSLAELREAAPDGVVVRIR
jgi:hypothetical protein